MQKKLDSKNMKIVYDYPSFFKLIRVCEDGKENLKPLILINGQIEHRIQVIETASDLTKGSCYQYSGIWEYDDNIHTPYIFLYDYPIHRVNKSQISNKIFSKLLCDALKQLNLDSVDIMGISNGGMIGVLTSKNERIDSVVAIHSPIYGAPCLNFEEFERIYKYLTLKEKLLLKTIKLATDRNFGYMQENKNGFSDIEKKCDISKILFTTSNIIETPSNNGLAMFMANMNKKIGIDSDGIVTVDQGRMDREGLNYILENGISHFEVGKIDYTESYYRRLIKR